MSGGPASVNISNLPLFIIAAIIAGGTLIYTQDLVSRLQKRERQIVELYAGGIEYIANKSTPDIDITFLFDNIIKPIDFPLILTDGNNKVNLESKTDVRNVVLDSTFSKAKLNSELEKKISEMDAINAPINVTYQDTIILQRIHFGDSDLIIRFKILSISSDNFCHSLYTGGICGFQ